MNYSARTERACARMAAEKQRRLTFRLLWLAAAGLLVLGAVLLGGR